MRFSLCLLLLAACASSPGVPINRGEAVAVQPVTNLSGVSVRLPEMYVGDMLGAADNLGLEVIDLRLVAQAALIGALRSGGRDHAPGARYELHGAITVFDARELRRTGRYRMALTVMLVDAQAGREITRAGADREFQLFDKAPDDRGGLGEERFIRRRVEAFTEALGREAMSELGLR